jgi:hypothetical protein
MNTTKPTLKFQIDIVDYQNDEEIINSIKKLLKLSKEQEFIDSVFWENGEKVSVDVSPNISFIISGSDCK